MSDMATDVGYTTDVVKEEPLRELTDKERTFVRNILGGMNQRNAYLSAGYTAANENSADSGASQLVKRPSVVAYMRQLKEAAFTANVLTLAEKRDYLARLLRSPISTIGVDSDLAQGAKYDGETGILTELKIPDKLKALELDAKLAGELGADIQVAQQFNFGALGDRLED